MKRVFSQFPQRAKLKLILFALIVSLFTLLTVNTDLQSSSKISEVSISNNGNTAMETPTTAPLDITTETPTTEKADVVSDVIGSLYVINV